MESPNNPSFSGGRKLERRNAIKVADYEPSDPSSPPIGSPLSNHYQQSSRPVERDASGSFRVTGRDSKEEIQTIVELLGLSGGADAFAIDVAAWDAGKTRRKSFDRLGATVQKRLPSEKRGFFEREVPGLRGQSPDSAPQQVYRPAYSNMSSMSSEDSFSSDGSKSSIEFQHVPVLPMHTGVRSSEEMEESLSSSDPGLKLLRTKSEEAPRPVLATDTLKCPSLETKRASFLPPPPIRLKPGFLSVSTHDILEGLAPEEQRELDNNSILRKQLPTHNSDHHDGKSVRSRRTRGRPSQGDEPTSISLAYQSQFSYRPSNQESEHASSLESRVEEFHLDDPRQQPLIGTSVPKRSEYAIEQTIPVASELHSQVGHVGTGMQKQLMSTIVQAAPIGMESWATATVEDSVGTLEIQSWRKLDMLGSGSYGTVYEAMSSDGVYFAVKEVSLQDQGSKAQQCISQLEQEIEMLSKYQHENIVQYLGTEKEHDKLYIFLEFVTKGSLASLYQKHQLFDPQIRRYTRQILYGLQYLHSNQIVHRDIKCANILVAADGKVKVADFGLARQISKFDVLKSCKGSAHWMAPEVIHPAKTYSFPADIWSLGCTVLEMATRRPPFGDLEMHRALWKIAHGEAPNIPQELSEDCQDFIRRCLHVEPMERPSASELLQHPFVRHASGSGSTPRNSFSSDASTGRLQYHSK